MKVIVNSGTIGTPVAVELARRGCQVCLTARTPKPNPQWDALGLPAWLVSQLTELNAIARAGWLAEVKPDAARILQRPPTSFARFIADHLAAFKA